MRVQKCKGTRDLLPGEMAAFRHIEGKFREHCLKWGYEEVRTPTIESLHLFTSAGTLTPAMLGRVYSFLDWDGWSGERVVLRPDGTIPIARMYIDSLADKGLARLFYVTNIFIFEETGKETRERWQCGAEIIGAGSPLADTELIVLCQEVLADLGVRDVQLRLSHAGLIKALLARLGLSGEEQARVFDQILDGNVATLAELQTRSPELKGILPTLFNLKGQSTGFLKNLKALSGQLPEIKPHLDNFIGTVSLLEALGYDYEIDIASGAGFEYYTGMIFQLFRGGEKIGGGGRYDALIPAMDSQDTPASGFALYIDRLMKLIKEVPALPASRRVLVTVPGGETATLKQLFAVALRLREAGYVARADLAGEGEAGVRWILEVRAVARPFTLIDRQNDRRSAAADLKQVLTLLEAEGAHQDSPA